MSANRTERTNAMIAIQKPSALRFSEGENHTPASINITGIASQRTSNMREIYIPAKSPLESPFKMKKKGIAPIR